MVSTPVYVQFKTPKIAVSDTGFYSYDQNKKELVVLNAGNGVFKLELGNYACINSECASKADFIHEIFSTSMPTNLIDDILDRRPLKIDSEIKSKNTTKDGFEERFSSSDFDIIYTVSKDSSCFVDKKNKIFIKITEISEK